MAEGESLKLDQSDLKRAVMQGIITPAQAEQLWEMVRQRSGGRPRFDTAHVAWYFGALIIIGAMGWFMTEAFASYGGSGLLIVATVYGIAFWLTGKTLWTQPLLRIPGGLLVTCAVCMVPLAVYGLQRMTGWWPDGATASYRGLHRWMRAEGLWLELATIAAGLLALRCVRFPFLVAPVAVALWYLSMDLVALLAPDGPVRWELRPWVSFWWGLAMLMVAWLVDQRTERDYAFWLYLFGMVAFWGGLTFLESNTQLSAFVYFVINLMLVALSVVLQRRVFIVFGIVGVFGYLAWLAHEVFADSLLFPVVLTLAGVVIIYAGVQWQRHEAAIAATFERRFPQLVAALVPPRRRTGA